MQEKIMITVEEGIATIRVGSEKVELNRLEFQDFQNMVDGAMDSIDEDIFGVPTPQAV